MTDPVNSEAWRAILCKDVDWTDRRASSVTRDAKIETLGALADMSERDIRCAVAGCGPNTIAALVAVLRRAMAGEDVTRNRVTLGDMAREQRRAQGRD